MKIQKRLRLSTTISLLMFALVLPSLAAKSLDEWTLEDVLQGILEANGGTESLENLTNIRIRGEIVRDDSSHEFVLLKKRPNMLRSRSMTSSRANETGFDGTTAWRRMEVRGYDKVFQIEDPAEIRSILIEADFDGVLIGDPPQGVTLRLAGVERIDRMDYFLVEVVSPDSTSMHYIDSRTFWDTQVVKSSKDAAGNPVTTVTKFSDNRKHQGIWIAHSIERTLADDRKETIRITDVELNPGILGFSFKMPEERNPYPGD